MKGQAHPASSEEQHARHDMTQHSRTLHDVTLRSLPAPLRQLLLAFLLAAAAGFTLGVFFVDHTTDAAPAGIAERYRGSEAMGIDIERLPADREIQYEKSSSELLNITHTHIISLGVVFLLVGGIFTFTTGVRPALKSFLIIEPFVSLVLTFGGMWLVRFHHPAWAWMIAASGVLMTVCFYAMVAVGAYQLFRTRA